VHRPAGQRATAAGDWLAGRLDRLPGSGRGDVSANRKALLTDAFSERGGRSAKQGSA
jgi:hypothetical protein